MINLSPLLAVVLVFVLGNCVHAQTHDAKLDNEQGAAEEEIQALKDRIGDLMNEKPDAGQLRGVIREQRRLQLEQLKDLGEDIKRSKTSSSEPINFPPNHRKGSGLKVIMDPATSSTGTSSKPPQSTTSAIISGNGTETTDPALLSRRQKIEQHEAKIRSVIEAKRRASSQLGSDKDTTKSGSVPPTREQRIEENQERIRTLIAESRELAEKRDKKDQSKSRQRQHHTLQIYLLEGGKAGQPARGVPGATYSLDVPTTLAMSALDLQPWGVTGIAEIGRSTLKLFAEHGTLGNAVVGIGGKYNVTLQYEEERGSSTVVRATVTDTATRQILIENTIALHTGNPRFIGVSDHAGAIFLAVTLQ